MVVIKGKGEILLENRLVQNKLRNKKFRNATWGIFGLFKDPLNLGLSVYKEYSFKYRLGEEISVLRATRYYSTPEDWVGAIKSCIGNDNLANTKLLARGTDLSLLMIVDPVGLADDDFIDLDLSNVD